MSAASGTELTFVYLKGCSPLKVGHTQQQKAIWEFLTCRASGGDLQP